MSLRRFMVLTGASLATLNAQSRDTSFTTWSVWQQIRVGYPDASPAEQRSFPGVTEVRNIVYASPGGRDLHLDLFVPPTGTEDRPCVLLIHGGGWRSGSKEQEIPFAQHLAVRGYVAATVEYRLSGEARFPAGVHDVKAAVRWLRKSAAAYSIDPDRIAAVGGSAGGTLAAFLAVTGDDAEWEGEVGISGHSSRIQAAVDIDGIVDFTDPAESGKDSDPAKPSAGARWFGAPYVQEPEVWKKASPLEYAGRSDAAPVLFLNSGQERFRAGRDSMMVRMARSGIHSEAFVFEGAPHPIWLLYPWFPEVLDRTDRFLGKVLKGEW